MFRLSYCTAQKCGTWRLSPASDSTSSTNDLFDTYYESLSLLNMSPTRKIFAIVLSNHLSLRRPGPGVWGYSATSFDSGEDHTRTLKFSTLASTTSTKCGRAPSSMQDLNIEQNLGLWSARRRYYDRNNDVVTSRGNGNARSSKNMLHDDDDDDVNLKRRLLKTCSEWNNAAIQDSNPENSATCLRCIECLMILQSVPADCGRIFKIDQCLLKVCKRVRCLPFRLIV